MIHDISGEAKQACKIVSQTGRWKLWSRMLVEVDQSVPTCQLIWFIGIVRFFEMSFKRKKRLRDTQYRTKPF
jgi:hypothetical protein